MVERREVRGEWRRNGREKNQCKNRTREDGWREKRGGMGILENKVRATASVHRRRPWNGELCRFVQPAASWCAPTRYFGLSFAAERPPSANIGSKQNYKLCPTSLAPRTLPTSTDTPLLLPRSVQRARGYACVSLHRWPLRGVTSATEFVIRE